MKHYMLLLTITLMSVGCATNYDTIGQLEVEDPRFHDVIAPGTPIEIVASGFSWIEGPVWIDSENALVFSNIPPNKAWKWTEANGAEHYLSNAGDYDGPNPRPTFDPDVINCPFDQPGSNGLTLSPDNRLVLMQHGSRSVA